MEVRELMLLNSRGKQSVYFQGKAIQTSHYSAGGEIFFLQAHRAPLCRKHRLCTGPAPSPALQGLAGHSPEDQGSGSDADLVPFPTPFTPARPFCPRHSSPTRNYIPGLFRTAASLEEKQTLQLGEKLERFALGKTRELQQSSTNSAATAKASLGAFTFWETERSKNEARVQRKPNFISTRTRGIDIRASSVDVRDGPEPAACTAIPPPLQLI